MYNKLDTQNRKQTCINQNQTNNKMNSQEAIVNCWLFSGTSTQDNRLLYGQELVVCLLGGESVNALRGKQITPYPVA